MTVILVLFTFIFFLTLDFLKTRHDSRVRVMRGTMFTTPGFEALGALAQDGGTLKSEDAETDEVLAKLKRSKSARVAQ